MSPELTSGDGDQLLRKAMTVLLTNWRGNSTVPSRGLYPHQWSWDSAFIALGLQHCFPRRAAIELLSLCGGQWLDGRIPHIVFNPAVSDEAYFPGPSFWRSAAQDGSPPVATSGIVQPPVHAHAAAALTRRLGVRAQSFAERIYPRLVAQSGYLRQRRTVLDRGNLAAVVHPWETGLDNSPAWDAPLHAVPADLGLFNTYTRQDLAHAGAGERPTDEDYARYIRLALAYRDHHYDDDWVRAEGEFLVLDPAFNALWAWSELALADLAGHVGTDPTPHRTEARRITDAMVEELWSEQHSIFHARDARTGQALDERTVAGLLPLILPDLPDSVVSGLISTLTGEAFRAQDETIHGVPSFDLTDPRYDAQRYWRGPTWLNTTWLLINGLQAHGHHELARKLTDDIGRLTERAGLREYFNPTTGSGHGTDDFSWSAALLIDSIASLASHRRE
ncbi:MAG TPA: hypothetical protein VEX66_08545 [Microlunatus sp.]|nr:hypothetical protein [Microlunatus sp.]